MEDQLFREERIRLECLAQAVTSYSLSNPPTGIIIDRAKEFQDYIQDREEDVDASER